MLFTQTALPPHRALSHNYIAQAHNHIAHYLDHATHACTRTDTKTYTYVQLFRQVGQPR